MAKNVLRIASRQRVFGSVLITLLIALVAAYLLWSPSRAKATTTELFFSEYIEGSSNNKALEIYNDTGVDVNLGAGGYSVQMFFNGATSPGLTISLTGTVAKGDVYVVAQSSANAAILAQADQTNSSGWYNGDDAVALVKGTTVIDVIGQIGVDPGTEWGTGATSTADNTLRRKATVCAGDSNGSDPFDPQSEWDGFAVDTVDGLGLHSALCVASQTINTTCPTPLNTTEGSVTSAIVSATDPDGIVTSATIISAPVSGIALTNFVAAAGVGGTATATLAVDGATASGSYDVTIQYSNNDSPTPEAATCVITVNVSPPATPGPSPAGSVVISQLYGGGGNSGATLKNDFIEILNRSDGPIDLSGWSVQYASSTGTSWQVTPLANFTLQPGQYYLIQEAAGAGGTDNLPSPDASGGIAMAATSGKVALVSNGNTLAGACPAGDAIIDFIGYGTANCFEGAGPAVTLSNTTAAIRGNDGCADTDNNSVDFASGSPLPRNTSAPTKNCNVLTATGSANPSSVTPGDTSTLTVNVFPASNPPSSGITVTADLTTIGGSPTQPFSGMGNTFTFLATVAPGTTPGVKSLPVTVLDSLGRSANAIILLNIQSPHVVISQIYGGGGNSGATYTNDFVELYNPTNTTFDLTGWSIQYASATGSGWESNKQPIGGTVAPGEYYLIELASNGAVGAPLPAANISGEINMSGSTGKVALVSSFQGLNGTCPLLDPHVVDFVGYGSSAGTSGFCFEGHAGAPPGSNSTSVTRNNAGATDTNDNANDFTSQPPNPRRTAPIVELGPIVLRTDPLSNDFNIPHDATITISFTEAADVDPTWYNINCATSGLHNDATVAISNGAKTYAITPNSNFQFGEQCTVTINKDSVHDQDLDDSGTNTDTLWGDYSWTFTVVAAGQPAPYPPDVHLTMGNPSNAVTSIFEPNNYLMVKPTYSLSYNRDKGTPNWVSWHLDASWFGSLARFDTFRPDPAVPPDWYRVQATDYFTTGFDRGHMTPNADRDNQFRIPINQETYLMSNMVPQAPDNNQGPWANMENALRAILTEDGGDNEMYIVSGPLGAGGTGSNGPQITIANGHVTVPAFTWKVVLVLPKGENDTSRVTAATRTIAVMMPNIQGIRTSDPNDWMNYLTTVDAVEDATGYDFFGNVPDIIENAIEAGTNGNNPPGTENQSSTTPEDVPVSITINAISPLPNATFTTTILGEPGHGTVSGTGLNLTYTPAANYFGNDSFTFKVNDGSHDSNASTINITVTSVNDAPVSAADSYVTDSNVMLNVSASGVLGNDTDIDSSSLSAALVSGPTHGSLTLNADGSFSYSPNLDFTGTDSFTYQAFDGVDSSNHAVVTITVNDTVAPVINSSVATSLLPTTNSTFINVGLAASATDNSGGSVDIQVAVFGDEDDETPTFHNTVHSPDAKDIALGTLRLRGERIEESDGRVYLIILTATDTSGNVSHSYQSVVVPKSNKQSNIDSAIAQGASAIVYAQSHNGSPPPSFFVIGDGPIIGPKQ